MALPHIGETTRLPLDCCRIVCCYVAAPISKVELALHSARSDTHWSVLYAVEDVLRLERAGLRAQRLPYATWNMWQRARNHNTKRLASGKSARSPYNGLQFSTFWVAHDHAQHMCIAVRGNWRTISWIVTAPVYARSRPFSQRFIGRHCR